ncbi:MAG: helix-turn-helix transcriptional regulator [Burkholderiales bacterium]|nr:helix-turn-helix transcriptional regulator [Burkholderiales bacterium]
MPFRPAWGHPPMTTVQIIEQDGKPAFYAVPATLWRKVRDAIEDAQARTAFDHAVADDDGDRVPAEVAFAIADGTSPVRAWREYRGISQDALAQSSGLSKPFVSQIESGKRAGTTATLKKLAAALAAPLETLA